MPTQGALLTSADVVRMVRRALDGPPLETSTLRLGLDHVRQLQQEFRSAPLGGRLLVLKKVFHWFTASAFDRQAKVVEAVVQATEGLVYEVELAQAARRARLSTQAISPEGTTLTARPEAD